MNNSLFIFCFIGIYLLNIISAEETVEMEHEVMVKGYGTDGIDKTVSLNLTHSLKPGSVIVVVTQTDKRGTINICDEKYNNLIHIDTRLLQGRVILNSFMNKKWGSTNVQVKPPPVEKGAQSVTTILYEEKGYRIFINGKEVAFYEHRSTKKPQHLLAFNNKIFKIVYLATKEIKGVVPQACSSPKQQNTI